MRKKNNYFSFLNQSNIPFLNLIISIKSNKTNVITESQIKMELIINKYIQ